MSPSLQRDLQVMDRLARPDTASLLSAFRDWATQADLSHAQQIARFDALTSIERACLDTQQFELNFAGLDSLPQAFEGLLSRLNHVATVHLRECHLDDSSVVLMRLPNLSRIAFTQCTGRAEVIQAFSYNPRVAERRVHLDGLPAITRQMIQHELQGWMSEASGVRAESRVQFVHRLADCVIHRRADFFADGLLDLGDMPPQIGLLRDVRSLSLRDCGVSSLPDTIGQLSRLECLDISNNSLARLPDSLMQLPALERLLAHSNLLEALPAQGMTYGNLRYLALSSNYLGEFPSGVLQSRQLRELHLDNNFLTRVPEEIRNLNQLTVLNISRNELAWFPQDVLAEFYFRSVQVNLDDNPGLLGRAALEAFAQEQGPERQESGELMLLSVAISEVAESPMYEKIRLQSLVSSLFPGWPDVNLDDRQEIRAIADYLHSSIQARVPESAPAMETFLGNLAGAISRMNQACEAHYRNESMLIMKAMVSDQSLFKDLCELAQESTTNCADRTLWVLSEMKLRVLSHQIKPENTQSAWQKTLDLGREYFQLGRCDELARQKMINIEADNPRFSEQLEVGLFFRVALRQFFPNLGFPESMFYTQLAHVSPAELAQAQRSMAGPVRVGDLVDFLKNWGPWKAQCETSDSFRKAKAAIDDQAYARMERVFARKDSMSSAQYERLCQAIAKDRATRHESWLAQYTRHKIQLPAASSQAEDR